jgi:hypothetical protein
MLRRPKHSKNKVVVPKEEEENDQGMKFIQLHLVPRLRMSGDIPLLLLCLHDVDRDNCTFNPCLFLTSS